MTILDNYLHERRVAQIALAITGCMMCGVVYLSILGPMPWWATAGILLFAAGMFFFAWIRGGAPPWWAYFHGKPIAYNTNRQSSEIGEWFQENNLVDRVYLPEDHYGVVHFRKPSDATLFKLTWGGTL